MSRPSRRTSRVGIVLTALLAADLLVTWGAHVAWLRRGAPGILNATNTGTIAVGVFSALPYIVLGAAQVVLPPRPRVRATFVATVSLVTAMALLGYVGAAFYYFEDHRGPLDGVEMLGIPLYQLGVALGGLAIAAVLQLASRRAGEQRDATDKRAWR